MACLSTCCLPVIELLCVAGFTNWAARRCLLHGSSSSEDWIPATSQEMKDIPRVCRIVLGVYEEDIRNPVYEDKLIFEQVIKHVDYDVTDGNCPPYLIYLDHEAKDVTLAIRGLHLANTSDYTTLLKKGQQEYDGGYVHYGLFQAANWLLDKELETIKSLLESFPDYSLTLSGHSLGSGIASLMTIVLMNSKEKIANISRNRIKCYAFAPARCTSLNIAVKYADNVKSIVLQDDFLPRTTVPLQVIFCSLFCLPCLLTFSCFKETFISEERKLRDRQRLYAPGRLYHIVYSEFCSCEELGPVVRTSIPVSGRFEHIVCSITASDDHSLVHLEKRLTDALQLLSETEVKDEDMKEEEIIGRDMALKKLQRAQHVEALEKAVSLGIHGAKTPEQSLTLQSMSSDNLANWKSMAAGRRHMSNDASTPSSSSDGASSPLGQRSSQIQGGVERGGEENGGEMNGKVKSMDRNLGKTDDGDANKDDDDLVRKSLSYGDWNEGKEGKEGKEEKSNDAEKDNSNSNSRFSFKLNDSEAVSAMKEEDVNGKETDVQ